MSQKFQIKNALISVSDKTNIEQLAKSLDNNNIPILSSGGTAKHLTKFNIKNTEISEYSGHPEILGGRVKTLHPKIHGGILARDELEHDLIDLECNNISRINLVIVNLYPFENKLQQQLKNSPEQLSIDNLIEYIDIGGVTLIRAAAKNYQNNIIIVEPEDYLWLTKKLDSCNSNAISITLEERRNLASKAFKHTSKYESAISGAFEQSTLLQDSPETLETTVETVNSSNRKKLPSSINLNLPLEQTLRYGENPEQVAGVYTDLQLKNTLAKPDLIQGKELSYNNLVDSNSAVNIIKSLASCSSFKSKPSCVIIKHATPCGIACADSIIEAYQRAFDCDSASAFGGIIAINKPLDANLADTILSNQFLEVLITPEVTAESLEILKTKPNIRVINYNFDNRNQHLLNNSRLNTDFQLKTIDGGLLVQSNMTNENLDNINNLDSSAYFNIVTDHNDLSDKDILDLKFSWYAVQHVKSNAIVIASNLQTIGIGGGQTSRVGSVELALHLANKMGHKNNLAGSILASDAFFPFSDSVEIAAKHGIKAIIQPGGSKADSTVIAAANKLGLSMVFTSKRKFYH